MTASDVRDREEAYAAALAKYPVNWINAGGIQQDVNYARRIGYSEAFLAGIQHARSEQEGLAGALEQAQKDLCASSCILGPPRPHCPACVDATEALAGWRKK